MALRSESPETLARIVADATNDYLRFSESSRAFLGNLAAEITPDYLDHLEAAATEARAKAGRGLEVQTLTQRIMSERARPLMTSREPGDMDKARILMMDSLGVNRFVDEVLACRDVQPGVPDEVIHDALAATAADADRTSEEAVRMQGISEVLWQPGQDGQPGSYGF